MDKAHAAQSKRDVEHIRAMLRFLPVAVSGGVVIEHEIVSANDAAENDVGIAITPASVTASESRS